MRSALIPIGAATAAALILFGCQKAATTPAAAAPAATATAPAATPMAAAPMAAAPMAAAPATPMAATAAAPAAGAGGKVKLRMACAADIQKFCGTSGEKPGKCLRPHMAELTPQCSQAFAARRAARAAKKGGGAAAEE